MSYLGLLIIESKLKLYLMVKFKREMESYGTAKLLLFNIIGSGGKMFLFFRFSYYILIIPF